MRRAALLVVLAALVLIVAFAWQAPATLITGRLERLTDGRMTMAQAEGTLWHGHGVLAAGDARIPLAWRLHPIPLLRGEIAVDLLPGAPGASSPRGGVAVGERSVRFTDFAASFPASAIAAIASPRPQVDAAGIIDISTASLDWKPPAGAGNLLATWHEARIGLAGGEVVALGEISATLTTVDGHLLGPIGNRGGDFGLAGEVSVQSNGAGALRVIVQPRRADDPRAAGLAMLGVAEAGGVRLDWRWPGL